MVSKMNNAVFGELVFNTGWKTKSDIVFFGKNYNIVVKAKAYSEKDGITNEQETAFNYFKTNKDEQLKTVEKLLTDFADGETSKRFVPRVLLFQRDGGYALLFDDRKDEDDGVAVCLAPKTRVVSQDEYL